MFLTFSMPRLSPRYAGVLPLALPYIVPVLQTSLTVSVYMTVAIAITALLYIIKPVTLDQPSPTSPDQKEGKIVFFLLASLIKFDPVQFWRNSVSLS